MSGDERMEGIIGGMLRAGVLLSSGVALGGGIWYLAQFGGGRPEYTVFRGEPAMLRSIGGIVHGVSAGDPRAWIQLGLLLLISTPVARVLFSIFSFAVERDRTYVVITLIVAAVLLYSLFGEH